MVYGYPYRDSSTTKVIYMLYQRATFNNTNLCLDLKRGDIRDEPMLVDCSTARATELAGPLMTEFMSLVATRTDTTGATWECHTHALFPGACPSVPGWHHDSIMRTKNGLLDYSQTTLHTTHWLVLIGGVHSTTEFLVHVAPPYEYTQVSTQEVNAYAERKLKEYPNALNRAHIDGLIYQYTGGTLHRGVYATSVGMRWYARATTYSKEPYGTTGYKPQERIVYGPPLNSRRQFVQLVMKDGGGY